MIDYEDKRFDDVLEEKEQALKRVEDTYDGLAEEARQEYEAQIDNVKAYESQLKAQTQAQTQAAVAELEGKKAETEKAYETEQSGAYVDYRQATGDYGANAEALAAAGMENSGYGESSRTAMFNAYQNRLSAARSAYEQAVAGYNTAITQAWQQNNAALAKIAFDSLQQQLELALSSLRYGRDLRLEQAEKERDVEAEYYDRYQDVQKQINTEEALAEKIRQFNIKNPAEPEANKVTYGAAQPQHAQFSDKSQLEQSYYFYKNTGGATLMTDAMLRNAVRDGLMTQREATELRNKRYRS